VPVCLGGSGSSGTLYNVIASLYTYTIRTASIFLKSNNITKLYVLLYKPTKTTTSMTTTTMTTANWAKEWARVHRDDLRLAMYEWRADLVGGRTGLIQASHASTMRPTD
jgi:hypothetical protein